MTKAKRRAVPDHDYFAIIRIGGGSSWGRAPDMDDAVSNAIRSLRDWMGLFKVEDTDVVVNVVDVLGYSTVDACAGDPRGWLFGVNETTGKREPIDREVIRLNRRTPKWKRTA